MQIKFRRIYVSDIYLNYLESNQFFLCEILHESTQIPISKL